MKPTFICLSLAACAVSVSAAELTNVSFQGGMLMPEVYYHADTDMVTVDLSAIRVTAQLTPLLISNPSDSFSPADPWFSALEPSGQGLAFSRRYGFDIDALSDIPPDNRTSPSTTTTRPQRRRNGRRSSARRARATRPIGAA
jgi:hypothetical protein